MWQLGHSACCMVGSFGYPDHNIGGASSLGSALCLEVEAWRLSAEDGCKDRGVALKLLTEKLTVSVGADKRDIWKMMADAFCFIVN